MFATDWGAYVSPWDFDEFIMKQAIAKPVRAWRFRGRWCSAHDGKKLFKRQWHPDAEHVGEFLEQCRAAGILKPKPGGYAYPWQEWNRFPRLSLSSRAVLHENRRGIGPHAWMEALQPGEKTGQWFHYDLRSAYAWASSCRNLPHPHGAVYTNRVTDRRFGVYLLTDVRWGARIVPRRLRRPSRWGWWVTKEEIEAYDAHAPVVKVGIEFPRAFDLSPAIDRVLEQFPLPTAKRILQRHWGSWLSRKPVEQYRIRGREIERLPDLPPVFYNPVWAWHLISRVSLRCAEFAGAAAHVYVDSLMVPHSLPEGPNFGDWRLDRLLEDPWISKAGNYGERGRVLKHAGLASTRLVHA